MPRWTRKKGDYLVKSAKMIDGEILHLIVGITPGSDEKFDSQVYTSFQEIRTATGRSALWMFGTGAFATLSHFGALKGVSASGLEVLPAVFNHVALLSLSLSTMMFCFIYCKQTYFQCWFTFKIKNQPPAAKARAMLSYPDAYWHFLFMPGNIGYPPHIHGRRTGYGQLAYIGLVIIALALFSVGSIALWITVASDVYNSMSVGKAVTWLTLSLSVLSVLLGWTSPFYYDWPRKYVHYGLVNMLMHRDEAENKAIHKKLIPIAARMGLVDVQ